MPVRERSFALQGEKGEKKQFTNMGARSRGDGRCQEVSVGDTVAVVGSG